MPQVTVYIRKDDLEKWESVEKKSKFIHNALNPIKLPDGNPYSRLTQSEHKKYSKTFDKLIPKSRIFNTAQEAKEIVPLLVPPLSKNIPRDSKGLCKIHGTPLDNRGRCLQKGCKYA